MRHREPREKAGNFNVTLSQRCRAKLERLRDGSGRRSLANVIEYLIERENERAPEWNVLPVSGKQPSESPDTGETCNPATPGEASTAAVAQTDNWPTPYGPGATSH